MLMQVVNGLSWCFHNVPSSQSTTQDTSTDCSPPLNYACEIVTDSTESYGQSTGPMYRCQAGSGALGQGPVASSSQPAGTPIQTKSYQGVFEPNFTAQAPTNNYPTARTPLLEAGQVKLQVQAESFRALS